MAAQLALNLTHDAIDLLHDTGAGWVVLGSARLEAPDFARQLAGLRATAAQIGGMEYHTVLIVPQSEILYTSASATGQDAVADGLRVRETLDGATPYAVSELAFDWITRDDRLRIAVVARETLAEAETFAEEHGFRPIGFTAIPPDTGFDVAPWFGPTTRAGEIVAGAEMRPDPTSPIAVTGALSAEEVAALIAERSAPPQPDTPPEQKTKGPETPQASGADTPDAPPADGATTLRAPERGSAKTNAPPAPAGTPAPDTPAEDTAPTFTSRRGATKTEPNPAPGRRQRAAKKRARKAPPAVAKPGAADDTYDQGTARTPAAPDMPEPTADAPVPVASGSDDLPTDTPPAFTSIRARRDAPPARNRSATQPDLPPPPTLDEPTGLDPAPAAASALRDATLDGFVQSAGPSLAARHDDSARRRDEGKRSGVLGRLIRSKSTVPTAPANRTPSEAESLTVFGARAGQTNTGAAPGRGGLVLTGGIILVLLAIGIWAGIAYRDQVEAWLYGTAPLPEEVAVLPPVMVPEMPLPQSGAESPAIPGNTANTAPDTPPDLAQDTVALAGQREPDAQESIRRPDRLARLPDAVSPSPAAPFASARPASGAQSGGSAPDLSARPAPSLPIASAPAPTPTPPPAAVPETDQQTALLLDGDDAFLLEESEPEFTLLTPEETRARYAATGIWESAPEQPFAGAETEIERLYLAAIDPVFLGADAIDLPRDPRRLRDAPPARQSNPTPPGVDILLGEDGLVTPTPGGTLNPGGVLVFSGPPPTGAPPRRPGSDVLEQARAPEALANARPRPRPDGLEEAAERARLGGRSLAELGALRPRARPDSVVEAADALRAEAETIATREAEALATKQRAEAAAAARANSSALALTASLVPRARPADLAPPAAQTASAASGPSVERTQRVAPSDPTPVSVARQATESGLRLNRMNLIGVFGTPNDRRALVRMPSGRLLRLKVGDRIDGGRVAEIEDDALRYSKGGRQITLEMPRG